MATRKSGAAAAAHSHAELEAELAALKKEVAALRKDSKSKSSGGSDPRVDKLLNMLKELSESWKNRLEKVGL